jgi:ferrous iron transport protein A
MMPLNLVNTGEIQVIKKIGGNPTVKKHLADLGFNVGSEVCVLSSLGGNLIVKVKEARVAVSEGLARRIMV